MEILLLLDQDNTKWEPLKISQHMDLEAHRDKILETQESQAQEIINSKLLLVKMDQPKALVQNFRKNKLIKLQDQANIKWEKQLEKAQNGLLEAKREVEKKYQDRQDQDNMIWEELVMDRNGQWEQERE